MAQPPTSAHVYFSSDVRNMDSWAKRTGIPLTTAEALGTTYARAHRWLLALKSQLVQYHGWKDTRPSGSRMLFSIERPPRVSPSGVPLGPPQRLELPIHATSFFSPERRMQWQMVFHSDIFDSGRKLCQPLDDIFNTIQCLLTGLVTLVYQEEVPQGTYHTSRGLPKVEWVLANQPVLLEVFERSHVKQLIRACGDRQMSYKVDFSARH